MGKKDRQRGGKGHSKGGGKGHSKETLSGSEATQNQTAAQSLEGPEPEGPEPQQTKITDLMIEFEERYKKAKTKKDKARIASNSVVKMQKLAARYPLSPKPHYSISQILLSKSEVQENRKEQIKLLREALAEIQRAKQMAGEDLLKRAIGFHAHDVIIQCKLAQLVPEDETVSLEEVIKMGTELLEKEMAEVLHERLRENLEACKRIPAMLEATRSLGVSHLSTGSSRKSKPKDHKGKGKLVELHEKEEEGESEQLEEEEKWAELYEKEEEEKGTELHEKEEEEKSEDLLEEEVKGAELPEEEGEGKGKGKGKGKEDLLASPTSPPQSPRPQSQPFESAIVRYKIEQVIPNKYIQGWTCFGQEYDEDKKIPITIIPFKTVEECHENLYSLKRFNSDYISQAHLVCPQGVMIERVESDLETWVAREYNNFLKVGHNGMSAWWHHISKGFTTIFRDVLLGLRFLYVNDAYCGNFANISFTKENKSKLFHVKVVGRGELRARIYEDLDALFKLMIKVLLWGYTDYADSAMDWKNILKEGGVPLALRNFLLNLDSPNLQKWDLEWLLDEPFFWGGAQIESFILKMNAQKKRFLNAKFRNAMAKLLGYNNLHLYIESHVTNKNSPEYRVFVRGYNDQLKAKAEATKIGKSYHVTYAKDNIFFGVLSYLKNLLFHYNHHQPPVELTPHDIAHVADGLFGGSCSMIKNAISKGIIGMKSRNRVPFPI